MPGRSDRRKKSVSAEAMMASQSLPLDEMETPQHECSAVVNEWCVRFYLASTCCAGRAR